MTAVLERPPTAGLAASLRALRPALAGVGLGVVTRCGTASVEDYRQASRMTPRRRAEFLLGREALREAMAEARLPAVGTVPVVEGRPRLPAGVVGALSHSGGIAVALAGPASRYAAVGVDLELDTLPLGSAHLVLLGAERDWLATAPSRPAGERALISAFCAKEAAFKAFAQLPAARVDRLRQVRLVQHGRGFRCGPEPAPAGTARVGVTRVGAERPGDPAGTFAWTVLPTRGVPR